MLWSNSKGTLSPSAPVSRPPLGTKHGPYLCHARHQHAVLKVEQEFSLDSTFWITATYAPLLSLDSCRDH